jgi:hypothetical protein
VPLVYALADDLLKPFVHNGVAPYFNVMAVVTEVAKSVSVPADTKVTMQWLSIVANVMSLASSLGLGSPVYGIVASAGTLATSFMEQPGSNGGPASTVTATAEDLAAQLTGKDPLPRPARLGYPVLGWHSARRWRPA